MRVTPALLLLAVMSPAAAQTPAERASRSLEQDIARDRFLDFARDAHGRPQPSQPGVEMFQSQRRSFEPDVGRPEEAGSSSPSGTRGTSRMGQNPQR
ncbi:MAG: hypothetical protein IRY87_20455 [Acetobacteraceae bacterium]|nr:hypothetical protein [Acetobacteraceae bacterium]